MKILQITNSGALSGGVFQMLELTKNLIKKGHDITIACRPDSKIRKKAIKLGIKHIEFPLTCDPDIRSMYRLFTHLRKARYDVVHAHHPKAHMIAMVSTLFARTPLFVVSRRVSFSIKDGKGLLNPLKYKFSRIDMIIPVAEAIKELLIKEGVAANKLRTVHSGSDPKRFDPDTVPDSVSGELGLKDDDIVISKIANYTPWKGHDCFFDAAKRVLEHNSAIRFVIAGNGTYSEAVTNELKKRGIAGNFHCLGIRPDVPEILKASDISVNAANKGEGLSGALREALFMGVPIVASDIAGNPEVCIPNETGLLFPPQDSTALADALITLAGDPETRKRMSKNGRELVISGFTTEAMADKTLKIYEELLKNGKR